MWIARWILLSLILAFCGCSQRPVNPHTHEPYPKLLSEWQLFTSTKPVLKPNSGVVPYDLNTPLFSDYAEKHRFVWMPNGTSAEYREDGPFEFPIGTVLAKTFTFPRDEASGQETLIETRLLVHGQTGWVALPYVWNRDQRDATLQLVPDAVPVHYTDTGGRLHDFTYVIPNANECAECHNNQKVLAPIGPKARNLNKHFPYNSGSENQLTYLTRIGYLRGLPQKPSSWPRAAKWDDPVVPLDARARSYLDNNCAHCHQPGGEAGYTGVDFRLSQLDLASAGLCKSPNSAGYVGGLRYDVIAGDPDHSVLIYRLESTAPKVSMPPLGRELVHLEGVQLLRQWIANLAGACP